MEWTEICVTVDRTKLEQAAAIAQMTVDYGIYIEDYSALEEEVRQIAHIDLIDEILRQKDRTRAVIHLYLSPDGNPQEATAFLEERLKAAGIAYALRQTKVEEEDWSTAWMKYYHPIPVGRRLLVCPQWEKVSDENRIRVILNPGMAFGTGAHETTRLCMQLLEEYVTPGDAVLDVGCGSGILAITAKRLGAKSATGVDLDSVAISVAGENAALNGVDVDLINGDLVEKVTGKFDVICANIVADVIIRLSRDVGRFMAAGAVLLCSGIIDSREEEVKQALGAAGLAPEQILRENGWVAIACKKA